jgi:Holliday junction DNA helicase RuvA
MSEAGCQFFSQLKKIFSILRQTSDIRYQASSFTELSPFSLFSQPMIAYLKGDFVHKSPAVVHVDVNGVGYEVQISLNTYSKIQNLEKGVLQISLLIREDAHILFGFFDREEKEMFLHLIGVSGIGATTARVMLSYMKPAELAKAIITGNTHALEGIKGIGKKTAERMVLELKDKLSKQSAETNISPMKHNTLHEDALDALMALGIARNAAGQAVQKVIQSNPSLTSLEDVIKKALKTM